MASAGSQNVVCKVGGIQMAMNGFGWDMEAGAASPPSSEEMAEATLPYYAHCLDAFGPSRCMFESVRDHRPPALRALRALHMTSAHHAKY